MNLKIKFKKMRGIAEYCYSNEINIANNLSERQAIESLYHEFTHWVIDMIKKDKIPFKVTRSSKVIQIQPRKLTAKNEEKTCYKIDRFCATAIEDFLNSAK